MKTPLSCSTAHFSSPDLAAGNGSPSGVRGIWVVTRRRDRRSSTLVTGNKKVEDSDWFRLGRVYAEAGEWDKARAAFDRALATNSRDDSGLIEYGALANVNGDREKAEALFEKGMNKNPREFWHWVSAGGSYLGVRPQ